MVVARLAVGWVINPPLAELRLGVAPLYRCASNQRAVLSKALRPMPEKWAGVQDTETCYRQRYLDLLSNPESREVFAKRSRIVSAIQALKLL